MKKILFSILALAALAGCAKEEILIQSPGEAIGFNSFVDNATRATDPSYGGGEGQQPLESFKVWGTAGNVAIYANDTVIGTVGSEIVDGKETHVWNCTSKTQYWIENVTYNFAALVNAGTVALGDNLLPATVEFEANGSTDLMYAENKGMVGQPTGQNIPVNFTFAHLLSKVYIGVTNNSATATGYSFLVKNIKINAPKTSGKYYIQDVEENSETIAAGTWRATAGDYTFENISVTGATAECNAEQLLIPGSATVSFDVDIIYNGSTITTKNYSHAVALVAGHAYRFNIIASIGDPIQFSVTDQPTWTNNGDITIQ